jgi:hypothetical protein
MTRLAFVLNAAAGVLAIAACGKGGDTDVDPTLQFSDLTDVEISRMVSAASASEGFQAQGMVFQFDDPIEPDPCPLIDEDFAANRVTITGGCTTLDGTTVEGTATLTNPTGWGELDYNFGDDSTYEFAAFSLTFGEAPASTTQSWDGVFVVGPAFDDLDLDLTTDSFGVTVRSDLYMDCSQTECEHGNSGLELVGKGGALVSGKIGVAGQTATGSMTLEGKDTVRVTIANNCTSWQLEGTDRSFDPCQ